MGLGVVFLVVGVAWIIFRAPLAALILRVGVYQGKQDPGPDKVRALSMITLGFGSLLAAAGLIILLFTLLLAQ
ncbi:hypothetical protein OIT41_20690 (plasmid) [Arthrobacter sp. YA7-1]|uniref:hypothetical protein n=1 Tax=Arthrobacter sp. YA7-1 TaxID=2987701 RepID=UPI0022270805|nr:hypothetical protein [Arthrobacter sp. YA7-1]UYY83685.1 hypothetical protein OIT41_20690 [Arthrobacter sp. YA7-1]